MSVAVPGPGFLLQQGDGGGPETFTTIAEVKDIKGPSFKTDIVDVTNQDSPNNTAEIIATLKRPGEVTFELNFNPANPTHDETTGMYADWITRVLRHYRLILNNGTPGDRWAFSAYVTGFDETAPVAGVLSASVTLSISGAPVLEANT